jgi:CHAT domain-containing protein
LLAWGIPLVGAIAQSHALSPQELITQGQQEFEQGDFQTALQQWQQAETLYRHQKNEAGVTGAQLNQAKAWQNLGFYRRSKELLEQSLVPLQTQPASELKAKVMLDYGNLLRLMGENSASKQRLQTGLAIAEKLQSSSLTQAAHVYLGNLLLVEQRYPEALQHFQQAATEAGSLQLTAQLHELKLLQQLDLSQDAIALLPIIESHLTTLPPSQRSIYAHIQLASLLTPNPHPSIPNPQPPAPNPLKSAQLLATAIQQAKALGNTRAESYATGRLGTLYQQTGQLQEAKRLTESAIQLARRVDVPEILYQWQWQLGRIFKAQGEIPAAIQTYTEAVNVLRSLRKDLTGLGLDVQFSFRDQVEPVYRELVDLLLQPDASQSQLKQARQVVESLQLAELNNFFREACLDAEARQIDEVDPTAAVIYPVILRDRLEIILSIPGQPLRHTATAIPQAEVEAGIQRMRNALRRTSFPQERLAAMGELYQWLIQPIVADLSQHSMKTLVFVLDGSLRNLPMAALYDGHQYLIERYQIASTPGLQLMSPQQFSQQQVRVLVAGLSESVAGSTPLPGVKQEVDTIQRQLPAQVLLDQSFTTQALKAKATTAPFTLVHLATHGSFGSSAEDTFLQAWNGRLTVDDLRDVLSQRSLKDQRAIELLVLSACQTAEGNNRAALGMAGLAVRSGARSTLATLWAVNDASTARFIAEFYQRLLQPQVSKTQAVREAQLALLHSQEFSHPYFWAPFILVGNWL